MNELVHASLPMSVQAKHSLVCHWFGVKETTWRVCALSAWRVLGVLGEGVHGGVCLEGEWQSNETSYAIVGERGNCDESSIIGPLA